MSAVSAGTESRAPHDATTNGNPWVRVCAVSDLTPDRGAAALVGSEQVAIFLLSPSPEGTSTEADPTPEVEIYAIDNRDPYSGANVMARGLVGSAGEEPTVASPIYKQRFRLRDGSCLDGDQAVRSWPVRLVDGWVEVGRDEEAA